ncbi:MAG: Rpn family recombination-promoting nuclease/putative transposase [Spirochaetaceae bacterium]|jgi:hypothetical protein|nr:Rpn family recombination-promoting nuclease/putative transposase [Spirochaetaceae bacterium]
MGGAYKDSLFRSLFNNKKSFLSLYNAVSGKNYDENTQVEMVTLTETLFTMKKNDVAGIIANRLIIAVEHQSSLNENMPFRFLSHIARLLENTIVDKSAVYREKLMKLPRPEFIVLCNSPLLSMDRVTLRLSDAFEKVEGCSEDNLELTVKLFNINKQRNTEIVERCVTLRGYVEYVDIVRITRERIEKENPGMDRKSAAWKAVADSVTYCKKHGILKDFFENLSPEEVNMIATEWNLEDAVKVAREEGREEGIEKERKWVMKLLEQGKSINELKRIIETSPFPL